MNLLDEDSEDDSDYVPEDDVVEEVSKKKRKIGEGGEVVGMNSRRNREASSVWEELQRADQEYVKGIMEKSLHSGLTALEKPSRRMKVRANKFVLKFLKQTNNNNCDTSPESHRVLSINNDMKEQAMKAVEGLVRKTKVSEKRKFAGKEIIVQSIVATATAESSSKPTNSLDQALELIKGPKTINTVSKSSMDWENYKEKEGLQDDLAHSKEKYLERKEFLDRCDHRSFEQERDERLAKQAQRGTNL